MPSALPEGEPAPPDGRLPASSLAGLGSRPFGIYVHVPYCAVRCGYCDFNTYTATELGAGVSQATYAQTAVAELRLAAGVLGTRRAALPRVETVFVGGGTPTFTEPGALARLLGALPAAAEVTVEANPETVTPALARLLREHGVSRISLGAQSFRPKLLAVLERTATPDAVRRAVHTLRDANFDNLSLDLLYGIPGQSPSDLDADLAAAVELEPEHLSCYELEAKPGTRFAHSHGVELARQAEAMECYVERVVETLTGTGYRWYETANFCRDADGRELRAQHNLAIWHGHDYLGVGIGAVSTVGAVRRRNGSSLARYVEALGSASDAPSEVESLDPKTKRVERLMLGLRLDEPLALEGLEDVVDWAALERLQDGGLVEPAPRGSIRLTPRGRLLGDAVTAELVA